MTQRHVFAKQTDSQTQGRGIDSFGINRYTLLYIKEIINKLPRYNKGTPLYSPITYREKKLKMTGEMYIYIYITDPFCCTPETNTLKMNHTPINFFKKIHA